MESAPTYSRVIRHVEIVMRIHVPAERIVVEDTVVICKVILSIVEHVEMYAQMDMDVAEAYASILYKPIIIVVIVEMEIVASYVPRQTEFRPVLNVVGSIVHKMSAIQVVVAQNAWIYKPIQTTAVLAIRFAIK